MTIQIKAIYNAMYLNIMSEIMKELKLPQLIDKSVPVAEQCKTQPSDVVQLIVLDILSGRQAIVNLEKWATRIDLEKLIRPGLEPSELNDDTIGRHFDRLYDTGIHEVISTFLLQTYQQEKIPLNVFHGDTTSMSLYGAYEKPNDALQITYGYSRDRAGAKQIQFGLIGNEDGIPIYADVHDGNTSDKEWNPQVLERLHRQFEQVELEDGFVYVADSAAFTQKTLNEIQRAKSHLISRGGSNLKIVKEALAQADKPTTVWSEPHQYIEKTGAVYQFFETSATYYDHDVRLIVVESSALDKKKENTLKRRCESEQLRMEEMMSDFGKQPFHCLEDAEKAAQDVFSSCKLDFHTITTQVEKSEQAKAKRGRPKKDAVPEIETNYIVKVTYTFDQQRFDEMRRRASRFVLVTTLPNECNDKEMDAVKILELYKGQINIEMNFSFLKDPVYVDEIYLKKPKRVMVLGYLLLLALVVYRVFQRRLRQKITEENPLRGAGGRILRKPTGQAIFQLLKYIQVVVLELPDGSRQRQFGQPLTYEEKRILSDLGFSESIYL
ncbi:MAG: IS1634 family transposase [Lysinibacillus sp.]